MRRGRQPRSRPLQVVRPERAERGAQGGAVPGGPRPGAGRRGGAGGAAPAGPRLPAASGRECGPRAGPQLRGGPGEPGRANVGGCGWGLGRARLCPVGRDPTGGCGVRRGRPVAVWGASGTGREGAAEAGLPGARSGPASTCCPTGRPGSRTAPGAPGRQRALSQLGPLALGEHHSESLLSPSKMSETRGSPPRPAQHGGTPGVSQTARRQPRRRAENPALGWRPRALGQRWRPCPRAEGEGGLPAVRRGGRT